MHFFFFPQQAQHSPGPRASHRKALSWATTPASNRKHTARHQHQRQTRKNGGIPPTRRGSRGRHDHAPNGHRPYDHNGESPRKAGQRPDQLNTGPVQKHALALYTNAHCTQVGPRAQKGASLAIQKPCTKTAMQTCAAHMKAERPKRGGPNSPHKGPEQGTQPKRCQAAEKTRNAPRNANPLPRSGL